MENNLEKIGFHKGSLSTLSKEAEELSRMLSIVQQLMQMHIKELQDLGVEISSKKPGNNSEKSLDEVLG